MEAIDYFVDEWRVPSVQMSENKGLPPETSFGREFIFMFPSAGARCHLDKKLSG